MDDPRGREGGCEGWWDGEGRFQRESASREGEAGAIACLSGIDGHESAVPGEQI